MQRIQRGVVRADVRGIGNDHVESPSADGSRPVTGDEFDVGDVQLPGVLPRDLERFRTDIGCRDARQRSLLRDRDGDRTAPGTEIENAPFGTPGNLAQRKVDE